MKTTDTTEKGFQKLIIKELVEKQGYIETNSNDFDQEFCINKAELLAFIKASQPVNYDVIQKKGIRQFLSRLASKIKKHITNRSNGRRKSPPPLNSALYSPVWDIEVSNKI